MALYVLQVLTRSEERFMHNFRSSHPAFNVPLYFPKREMREWKGGVQKTRVLPLFPGYLFAELDESGTTAEFDALRKSEGFYRFLVSNADVRPLSGRDLEVVMLFTGRKEQTAEVSKVYFDGNQRIVVVEGPLTGLEGFIVKVDRRRCRAKVKFDLYGDAFLTDLSYEVIQPV